MLDGVDTKAVDAELADPAGQPFDQVVAHPVAFARLGTGLRLAREKLGQRDDRLGLGAEIRQKGQRALERIDRAAGRCVVIGDAGPHPVAAPPGGPARVLVIHQVVVGVQVLVRLRLPGAPLLGQVVGHAVAQGAEALLLHVLQGRVAGVVHHHIEQHADAAGMGLADEGAQVVVAAHVGVELGEVECVVAVVTVVAEVAAIAAADPAVDLLVGRADPQRVDAQAGDMVEPLGQPLEVAAVEGADLLFSIRLAAIAAIVALIAIGEAVGEHEVDDRVAPVVRCRFGRLGGFEQQEAIAAGGGVQPDPAVADHRRGAGQRVAQGLAIAEHVANRHLHRAAIPGLADRRSRLRFGGLDWQQTQRRVRAGLDDQAIATSFGHFVAVGAVFAKRLTTERRKRAVFDACLRHHQMQPAGFQLQLRVVAIGCQGVPAR